MQVVYESMPNWLLIQIFTRELCSAMKLTFVETPLQSQKVTVRCALWAEGIVFISEREDIVVEDLWFQPDCALSRVVTSMIVRVNTVGLFLLMLTDVACLNDKPKTIDAAEENIWHCFTASASEKSAGTLR